MGRKSADIRYPPFRVVLFVLLAAGLLLWGINLLYGRPLFLDEANVVRNLYDRSYTDLFRPLDYEQYAPPLYLVTTKFLADLLGYREMVLRLPALLGGLMAVIGVLATGKSLAWGTGYCCRWLCSLPILRSCVTWGR